MKGNIANTIKLNLDTFKQPRRLFDEMKSQLCFSNNFQSMLR